MSPPTFRSFDSQSVCREVGARLIPRITAMHSRLAKIAATAALVMGLSATAAQAHTGLETMGYSPALAKAAGQYASEIEREKGITIRFSAKWSHALNDTANAIHGGAICTVTAPMDQLRTVYHSYFAQVGEAAGYELVGHELTHCTQAVGEIQVCPQTWRCFNQIELEAEMGGLRFVARFLPADVTMETIKMMALSRNGSGKNAAYRYGPELAIYGQSISPLYAAFLVETSQRLAMRHVQIATGY
jgi:hypothetical protein